MYSGTRVRLRPFEREDAERYRQWVNDAEVLHLVDRVLPVPRDAHGRWYDALLQDARTVIFALEATDPADFIGCVWLSEIDYRHRRGEVRILIGDKRYWGKGFGEEAIRLLVRFAFDQLNLHKVFAYVLATNPRALRAFEKAGFEREGLLREDRFINGQYTDVVRLGVIRQEPPLSAKG